MRIVSNTAMVGSAQLLKSYIIRITVIEDFYYLTRDNCTTATMVRDSDRILLITQSVHSGNRIKQVVLNRSNRKLDSSQTIG